ncbi:MAG: SixA phosphatase family protein [Candidatus Pollutiaquabacter aromativorans]
MKRLYLVRHAKSSWEFGTLPDAERPLNERGYRDAPRVGDYLAGKYVRPEAVVSSPAIRAYSTAFIICRRWDFPVGAIMLEPGLYETDTDAYADVIRQQDDRAQSLLLAGHNFSITHFLSFMLGKEVGEMPTCSVAVLDLELFSWNELKRGSGRLLELVLPKALPNSETGP